ncbi:hypothetical protein, partial [Leuconostoc litchii]|uniref:hypothetical protein n=1 Tax=Leuconostoc litchii TaxID=1981069 RepID=UPI001FCB1649
MIFFSPDKAVASTALSVEIAVATALFAAVVKSTDTPATFVFAALYVSDTGFTTLSVVAVVFTATSTVLSVFTTLFVVAAPSVVLSA